MDRRIALVVLWTVFAAASIGVGFGAAGLVGGPFAAPGLNDVAAPAEGPVLRSTPAPEPTASLLPTGTGRPRSSSSKTSDPGTAATSGPSDAGRSRTSRDVASPSRTRSAPAPTRSRTASPVRSTQPPAPAPTTQREIQTRGGYVRASCTSGALSVAASPAVGWHLDRVEKDGTAQAEVRFEESSDDPGRVEIEAWCTDDGPTLVVTKDEDGSSGSGSGGSDD